MSIPRKITVSCPKCSKQYETMIFDSINTDFSPDLAQTIISGKRFDAKCPACGFIAHLEYDLLYNDMKHNAMIWVVHPNLPNYEQRVSDVRATNFRIIKTTRLVADMNELREKAACLEAGVDDRVIELCKVFLESQLISQRPDYQLRNSFYTYAGEKQIVFFYDVNGNETGCYLDDEVYDLISRLFKKPLQEMIQEPFRIVDSAWAHSFFSMLPEEELSDISPQRSLERSEENTSPSSESVKGTEATGIIAEKPPVLFCRKCGAKLLSDSLFCSYCGTEVVF